jgi:formylglycine-generating enzyme required for sulfatase activity
MKILPFCFSMFFAATSVPAQSLLPNDFVLVKGGTFVMGSPAGEPERGRDEIQRRVAVSDFHLARSEVTQREYAALMGGNPSEFKGNDLPVENLSWFDALRYGNARSAREGLEPAYVIDGETVAWNRSANGYRLPTEAEWEYAARAGTATPFSTGNTISDRQANLYNHYGYDNDSSGRIIGGSRGSTVPVKSFAPNAWGLFDMHGNVSEWCWDGYAEYGAAGQTDPVGPATATYRAHRGGGWNDFPKHARSAYRGAAPPGHRVFNLGFRLARNVK